MTKSREAGKGDNQRPTDHKKFSEGYDRIFGKKDANDPHWPFPSEPIPVDGKLPKFNPNNVEDAPI